jgi:hypothetical protein
MTWLYLALAVLAVLVGLALWSAKQDWDDWNS